MYYLKIKTKFNLIELIIDDFYDEKVQQLIQQPYVEGVYLRYINEKEYNDNKYYSNIKRLRKII